MSEKVSSENKLISDSVQGEVLPQENSQQSIQENGKDDKPTVEEHKSNEEKTSTKSEVSLADDKQENVRVKDEKQDNECAAHGKEKQQYENPIQSKPQCPIPAKKPDFPQDIRYSSEHIERDKIIEKFRRYEMSDTNACTVRFLIVSQQQKKLFGYKHQGEIKPGYQHFQKHSYKIFGTELNVHKCLKEILSKLFFTDRKYQCQNRYSEMDRLQNTNDKEKQQPTTPDVELNTVSKDSSILSPNITVIQSSVDLPTEQYQSHSEEKTANSSESIQSNVFVTTISSDGSIQEEMVASGNQQSKQQQQTEGNENKSEEIKLTNEQSQENPGGDSQEIKSINEEKPLTAGNTNSTSEQQQREDILRYHPIEKKPTMNFTFLLFKEVIDLWKRSSYFIGTLQQRLNVAIQRPGPKFGEKQFELQITGDNIDSIADACIQITAFLQHELGQEPEIYKDYPVSTARISAGCEPSDQLQQDGTMSENPAHSSTPEFPQRPTNNYNRYEQSQQQRSEGRFRADQNRAGYSPQQQPPFSISVYEQQQRRFDNSNVQQQFHPASQHYQQQQYSHESQQQMFHPSQQQQRGYQYQQQHQQPETAILIRTDCVARIIGKGGANLKLIRNRCHLRDIGFEPKDTSGRKEYIRCELRGEQRPISDAILMIRDMLKREGPGAVKDAQQFTEQQFNEQQQHYPPPSEYPNQFAPPQLQTSVNDSFAVPHVIDHIYRSDLTGRPLHFNSNSLVQCQQQQPSYNFNKNNLATNNGQIPQFDFVHRPTSGKKDKRQNESFEFAPSSNGNKDSYESQHQQSSSSNSSSTSPRHKIKRSCPETKEIPTVTDEGHWILQAHLSQLNEHDRKQFQLIMDKVEKIKLDEEKMKSKHQQQHSSSSSYRSRKQSYPSQHHQRQRVQTTIPLPNDKFDFDLKQHDQLEQSDASISTTNQNKSMQQAADSIASSSATIVEQTSDNIENTSDDNIVNKQQQQEQAKPNEGEKATSD
ncbi:unnamed protein product [Didymodactylos carnosus]|uniref:K Homology domain-containing protein n=1 Tax=Didymodactylos carnosus TaxID=1234261 RepID=A0A813QCI7_9BILA|nr:unnamed protein product [Didymodactylos carnosus]CAF0765623.1 unnamed protein product [Didymodactylos carnosus]CAF3520951.1 unnamed protein product [Didymodactylos carnosus]CAF3546952.1 unnamed protein product [Didymodactylos carnosus]